MGKNPQYSWRVEVFVGYSISDSFHPIYGIHGLAITKRIITNVTNIFACFYAAHENDLSDYVLRKVICCFFPLGRERDSIILFMDRHMYVQE